MIMPQKTLLSAAFYLIDHRGYIPYNHGRMIITHVEEMWEKEQYKKLPPLN